MIPFNERSINIDAGVRCTLQCPGCARTKLIKNGKRIPGKDLTIEQFDKIADYFERVGFCGTWSDPIFNKNFIEFLKICKHKNKQVEISTAASHKPVKWYEEAFNANWDAYWVFGIDGLPEESHKHRVNQDGVKLFNMMLSAKYYGLDVQWQYIAFDYNIHNVQKAKEIAKFHKIDILFLESERKYLDPELKNASLNNETKTGLMGWSKLQDKKLKNNFKPKCLLTDRDLSFSSTGHILPCCWLNTSMKEKHIDKLFSEKLHIENNDTVREIIDSDEWKNFFDKLENDPIGSLPSTCELYCSVSLEKNIGVNRTRINRS